MSQDKKPASYVDKDNREVQIASRSDTHVSFYPQGGGYQRTMTTAEFETYFKPSPDEPRKYERIKVSFGWADDELTFEAFSNGYRWNGWAAPSFTKEVGLALCGAIPNLVYDEATDRFIDKDEEAAPDYMSWGAEEILVDGAPVSAYAIGAGIKMMKRKHQRRFQPEP